MQEELNKLTTLLNDAREEVAAAEKNLKHANVHAKAIEAQLVLAMGSATSLSFDNGLSINRNDSYRVSMPTMSGIERTRDPEKQMEKILKREQAMDFLKTNGLDGIIDTVYTVKSDLLSEDQTGQIEGLPHSYSESVHSARLKAAVQDLMADGVDIPECIYVEKVSKVVVKKNDDLLGM